MNGVNSLASNPKIVGWMVGDADNRPAMYNLSQKEQAFDAARRWNSPIVALVVHPEAPQ